MAAATIPALGRDTAGSSLFDFAANLVRTHAALVLRDRPLDPPDCPEVLEAPAFDELPRSQQLRIAERISRQGPYRAALLEALPESDGYDGLLKLAVDADVSDAEIGRTARELILQYVAGVAAFRGEDLSEVAA